MTWHVLTLCLFFILLFLISNLYILRGFSSSDLVIFIGVTCLLTFYIALPYVVGGVFNQDYYMDYYRLYAGIVIFMFFTVALKYPRLRNLIKNVLTAVLLIHLAFILIQTIFIYSFNTHLDPLSYFGREQRIFGGAGTGLFRPSGFFNEPATYFTCISILLFCRFFISEKLDLLFMAIIGSFLLTLSVQALILSPFIFLAALKNSKSFNTKTLYYLIPILIIPAAYFAGPYIVMYLDSRFLDGDMTLSVRFFALNFFYSLSFVEQIVGSGVAINNCGCLMADTGLWFTLLSTFGLVGLIFIVLVIYKAKKYLVSLVMLSVILLGKSEIYYSLIWMFFSFLLYYISSDYDGTTND